MIFYSGIKAYLGALREFNPDFINPHFSEKWSLPFTVTEVIVHEDYDLLKENDIALVRIDYPLFDESGIFSKKS